MQASSIELAALLAAAGLLVEDLMMAADSLAAIIDASAAVAAAAGVGVGCQVTLPRRGRSWSVEGGSRVPARENSTPPCFTGLRYFDIDRILHVPCIILCG